MRKRGAFQSRIPADYPFHLRIACNAADQVRVLESERAFERLELTQTSMYDAIAFSTFLNAALILSATLSAGSPLLPVRVAWTLAGVFGLRIPVGLFKVRWLFPS